MTLLLPGGPVEDFNAQQKFDEISLRWPNRGVGVFSGGRAAAQAIAAGNYIEIVMTTEEWDLSSWFDPTTGRFTPKIAGYYRLNGCVAIGTAVAVGTRLIVALLKNGALHRVFQSIYVSGGNDDMLSGSAIVLANGTTDYFSIAMHQNTVGAINVGGDVRTTYFQGEAI